MLSTLTLRAERCATDATSEHCVFMAIIRNTFITQMYLLLSQTFRNNAGSQGLRLGVKAKADSSLTIVPHIRVKEFRVLSVREGQVSPLASFFSFIPIPCTIIHLNQSLVWASLTQLRRVEVTNLLQIKLVEILKS